MAFQSLVRRADQQSNVAGAFTDFLATDPDGSHAAGIARAFHAPSHGPGDASAPPYEPPETLSPAASWRGGVPGAASLLEMAADLVEHPLSASKREAFELGLREQALVIQELLEQQTGALPGSTDGHDDLQRLLAEQPLAVRMRLLQVYDKLRPAMAILRRSEGYDIPTTPAGPSTSGEASVAKSTPQPASAAAFHELVAGALAEQIHPVMDVGEEPKIPQEQVSRGVVPTTVSEASEGASAEASETKPIPHPALAAVVQELVAGTLAEQVQPIMEGLGEELKALREQISKGAAASASAKETKADTAAPTRQEEVLLATIAELKGQLEDSLAAPPAFAFANSIPVAGEGRSPVYVGSNLESRLSRANDTKADAAVQTRQEEALLATIAELKGQLESSRAAPPASAISISSAGEEPKAEDIKFARSPEYVGSNRGSRLSGPESGPSKRKSMPPDMPPGMPPISDWGLSPTTKGLERAKRPDFAGAWASIPPAESKAARKQLVESLAPSSLISDLPTMGDVSAYMLMRGPMLENWYLFKEFVNAGGDGETALLRALVKCANTRHKTCGKQEGQWRGLMEATTVLAYLKGLDGMYVDRTHTAVEREWEDARAHAQNVLDYYLRMRHLLKNDDACSRGYHLLLTYLREKKDRLAFKCLQECDAYDHHSWHAALDSLRSVDEQFAAKPAGTTRAGTSDTAGKGLLGFGGSKTTTKTTNDDTKFQAGQLSFDTDITWEEATTLVQTLKALQDAQSKNEQSVADVQRRLAALNSAPTMLPATSTPPSAFTSPTDRFKMFAPSSMGGPPKVYDLAKIYSFLGLKAPVPARKGTNPGFTHGAECAVCSEFLGFTEFVAYDQLKGLGSGSGARAFHNAWKCSKIPAVIKAHADKLGTAAADVDELLTPIDDPHWKPRGA